MCIRDRYDIVSNSNDHTTLKTAIDACGLDGTLLGAGPFTLFAPTDAAFNLLPAGTFTALLNDIPQLTSILLHHLVQGSVMSSMLSNNQVFTTTNGTDITVTISGGNVYIDNAQVTVADIVADNGVVHVIDAVLLTNMNMGCTDPTALNYDPTANTDDGSCYYCDITFNAPIYQSNTSNTTCDGLIIVSATSSAIPITYNWSNGVNGPNNFNLCTGIYTITATAANGCSISDTFTIGQIIYGCMDPLASNYNPLANINDGSCYFTYGCMDSLAINYNSLANIDDGSCIYCDIYISTTAFQDPTPGYCNGAIIASSSSSYSSVTYSWNTGSTSNILTSLCLGIYELTATDSLGCFATQTYTLGNVIFGCTDATACNYNASANVDDNSCILPDGCIDPVSYTHLTLPTKRIV